MVMLVMVVVMMVTDRASSGDRCDGGDGGDGGGNHDDGDGDVNSDDDDSIVTAVVVVMVLVIAINYKHLRQQCGNKNISSCTDSPVQKTNTDATVWKWRLALLWQSRHYQHTAATQQSRILLQMEILVCCQRQLRHCSAWCHGWLAVDALLIQSVGCSAACCDNSCGTHKL